MPCYSTAASSPLGELTLASDGMNLVGLWMEGQRYFGGGFSGQMILKDDLPVFCAAKSWLERYFAGEKPAPSELPLLPAGTEFRQRVWSALCEIPYGATVTYGELAGGLGKPASRYGRAIGGAIGHNPISVIIPCHRVLGSGGSLTGYAGGLERKKYLLALEMRTAG